MMNETEIQNLQSDLVCKGNLESFLNSCSIDLFQTLNGIWKEAGRCFIAMQGNDEQSLKLPSYQSVTKQNLTKMEISVFNHMVVAYIPIPLVTSLFSH